MPDSNLGRNNGYFQDFRGFSLDPTRKFPYGIRIRGRHVPSNRFPVHRPYSFDALLLDKLCCKTDHIQITSELSFEVI